MNSTISSTEAPRVNTGHAEMLQPVDVLAGDRSSHGDHHVLRALCVQQLHQSGNQCHVGAGQDRQTEGVGVLLDHRLHDLLGRLVKPGVDHLHPGVPHSSRDDLRAAVVAVQAWLGHHDADPLSDYRRHHQNTGLSR
jgi:hypothetical protein